MQTIEPSVFQKKIYAHYRAEKRALPWRMIHNPYRILVSEMMLQQTQTTRVVPKYKAFLKKFPTVQSLARARVQEVLALWVGLGYNRRALHLKRTAEMIAGERGGRFPKTYEELITLAGIGPYTASAILVFAYNEPRVLIETNIRAVFIHFFFPRSKKVPDTKLLPLIEKYMDTKNPREWYNALMDYGAMLKATLPNPSRKSAHHARQSAFADSDRQVRGAIIRAYAEHPACTKRQLFTYIQYDKKRVSEQYEKLNNEGFFKT